jgi:hypothetical protein
VHTSSVGTFSSSPFEYTVGNSDNNDAWGFDGKIGEIVHLNRALSEGERQSLSGYLEDKWNGPKMPPLSPTGVSVSLSGRDATVTWSSSAGAEKYVLIWKKVLPSAEPENAVFDANSGLILPISTPGEYSVEIIASNIFGQSSRSVPINIVIP